MAVPVKKISKHIQIVRTSIMRLSSMSPRSFESIFNVLNKHYARVGVTTVNCLSDLEALVALKPDIVFLGMNLVLDSQELGLDDPKKVWITEYLDQLGIAYTGSSKIAQERQLTKQLAKEQVLLAGLQSSPYCVIKQDEPIIKENLPAEYPLFVKPTDRGGGLGIDSASVVRNFKQLKDKVNSISTGLQSDSIVEKYLSGREFSVAVLKEESSNEYSTMPLELVAPPDKNGVRILSGNIKTADSESSMEVTDEPVRSEISTLAVNVFRALEARDYGRIDIRLDEYGTPYFLEANLLPCLKMSIGNYFPKACLLNIGLNYEQMILRIVRLALEHSSAINLESSESDIDDMATGPVLKTALQPV